MPVNVVGGGDFDEHRAELPAVFAIGDPVPGSRSVFAGGNGRGMADQGDQFVLTFDFQTQHTKTVLLVVEGDAFNQAGEAVKCSARFELGSQFIRPITI